MVNFGLNSASILGIFLAVAGAGLYFMRSIRPELARDHDIFFAAVGLLCGFILLFQGWRLDPILQFGQFLLTATTIFFAVETIRLRSATAEQARRNSPIVDEDRRVSRSRVYTEAELDQIEPEDDESYGNKRRLRGIDYETDEPRSVKTRRTSRPSSNERYNNYPEETDRPTSSRRRSSEQNREDVWSDENQEWSEMPPPSRSRRPRGNSSDETAQQRPRNAKTPNSSQPRGYSNQYGDDLPAAYVDYQPIDEDEPIVDSSLMRTKNQPKRDNDDYDERDDSQY